MRIRRHSFPTPPNAPYLPARHRPAHHAHRPARLEHPAQGEHLHHLGELRPGRGAVAVEVAHAIDGLASPPVTKDAGPGGDLGGVIALYGIVPVPVDRTKEAGAVVLLYGLPASSDETS